MLEYDQNYISSVVSALFHKTGGGKGGSYSRGGAYFKFWPIGGALIRKGRLFERSLIRRGAYLRGELI